MLEADPGGKNVIYSSAEFLGSPRSNLGFLRAGPGLGCGQAVWRLGPEQPGPPVPTGMGRNGERMAPCN